MAEEDPRAAVTRIGILLLMVWIDADDPPAEVSQFLKEPVGGTPSPEKIAEALHGLLNLSMILATNIAQLEASDADDDLHAAIRRVLSRISMSLPG